ncbi:hypothetical protein [[Pseudomonas] boreopolis]|uniref:Uncharacterized protein n=1 Tax=Xanthomonas boreopolis TaxID=86183 RepID=A0A919F866_9XANT|nr:hypothetical protein GCM10009090_17690 [[Pseudomonas] boreopolis]
MENNEHETSYSAHDMTSAAAGAPRPADNTLAACRAALSRVQGGGK